MAYPGFLGKHHSEETKQRISLALKGRRLLTDEQKEALRQAHLGKPLTEEQKQKLSLALKGNQHLKGHHHSIETRLKMSQNHRKYNSLEMGEKVAEANKRRVWKLETRQKISEAAKRRLANPENHPNWQGGIALHPYPCRFNSVLKEAIRERDNYQCQLCGVPEIECLGVLTIHHIDYNKANLSKDNLISLCRQCNARVNFNREYWQSFFEAKIADYDEIKARVEKLEKK